jgi:hypothetical protein
MTGTMVDDDSAVGEMIDRSFGIVDRDHQNGGSLLRRGGRTNAEASSLRFLDQYLREVSVSLPNARYRHFIYDLLSAQRGMHHVQRGRAELETARIVLEFEVLVVERELITRAEPSGDPRRKLVQELRTDVQIAQSRAAQHPFERTRDVDINVRFGEGRWDLPDALVGVYQEQRAIPVRDIADRAQILNCARRIKDVTRSDKCRPLIDQLGKTLRTVAPSSLRA